MNLLFIANDFPSPWLPTKGVFNLNLARALARHHQVRVICPIPWPDLWRSQLPLAQNRFQAVGKVQVHYAAYYYPPKILRTRYGQFYWQSIRSTVASLLQQSKPDLVLGYWAHPDGHAAVRAAQLAAVPSAVILGGSDILLITKDPAREKCVLDVLHAADALLAVSQHLADKVLDMSVAPAKVYVWRQGVDTDLFAKRANNSNSMRKSRQLLGISEETPALVWVGRMVPVKALDVLLKAAQILYHRNIPFNLYLVGDGPLRPALEKTVKSTGLTSLVHFVGSRTPAQLPDWYRAAHRVVLPSHSEGLPNVLREAVACGTPFVASNVGGISEIATDKAHTLVPPGDPEALADAIACAILTPAVPLEATVESWETAAENLIQTLQAHLPSLQPGVVS